ncbi:FMN-binding negative transcriptional regulator [Paralimibaculum aggregatum]|uniref:FMN-binding negative transcriptional regulator n=1 Tax=Paralimibaculum aggregatum TaxID=3036245 RepID=A0ABQ6LJV7_9RHOB|nr:FMN-binding negative transcriptional regulator [Limibaculum sp. NKW23]GMG81952.1 FMN-binding negative transcriptional regulator [Limibaculum sp. NKW23]
MHPNPVFRQTEEETARAAAAARGFGVLTAAAGDEVLAAHVPFLLEDDRVEAHLVRSNPLARALAGGPLRARLIVSGPDAYVSPDWYGEPDLVPTWNYVAVHLHVTLALAPPESLIGHLERLSARFEAALAPKPPWTHHKMSEGVMARMMRQILPVEMAVERIESTFKLNQNRTAPARAGAADEIAKGRSPGTELAGLAALMRGVDTA